MGDALLGGALIGLAAAALLVLTGKTAGVSGIVDGVLRGERGEWRWKAAFLAGLVSGGLLLAWRLPSALVDGPPRGWPFVIAGGLLVGFGARLGGGCTSGHGVCGIGRGSLRGVVGTAIFIAAGVLTVWLLRTVAGA
ncbi:MAG TPA: YeeE/YedE thiosulfate transporter family protein [Planctomycetota bacterium]|nr:YeeE/YedE thiosulfate transporter family protein [Planctomycetota bacterium]